MNFLCCLGWHIKGSFGRLSNPCSYLGGSGRGICGLAAYSSSVWFETRRVKSVKGSVLPWGHSLVLKWRRPSFVRGHNPSNWFLIEATFHNLAEGAFNCLPNIILCYPAECVISVKCACVFVCNQSILIIIMHKWAHVFDGQSVE